jgi:hypothetical protein
MGMGGGIGETIETVFSLLKANPELETRLKAEEAARIRAEGGTPLGESVARTMPMYTPPTQTSDYANPIPQYQPSRFDFNPYAAAYQQQFSSPPAMPAMQALQMPTQPVSGLGALAQLYGMYNAAPQDAPAQDAHSASIAAAANTTI